MIYKIITSMFFICIAVYPQTSDTLYSLTIEAGAGYSHYITTLDYNNLNRNGFSGMVRIMWHPEHLLSLGIETGYNYLYSLKSSVIIPEFGTSEVKASMVSVPVLGIFAMKIFPQSLPNFELKFSSGIFILNNNGNAFGEEISSSQLSIGYMSAVTYLHPLNEKLSIGGELKYSYISKIQDSNFSAQVIFSYRFLSY